MTLREKIAQMLNVAPPIPRLDVPAYNWWNECLHGVGRAGRATVFPQAIGLAASFDEPLVRKIAEAISDEARAKHQPGPSAGEPRPVLRPDLLDAEHQYLPRPALGQGTGDLRRGPHLTARMGVAFVEGLQGKRPEVPETCRNAEALRRAQRPEPERHGFDA